MKLFTFLTAAVLASSAHAEPKTVLYMFSPVRDCVSQERAAVYFEGNDLNFKIAESHQHIAVSLNGPSENWNIDFAAPDLEKLKPGIYRKSMSQSCQEPPYVNVAGYGKNYKLLPGEFEVLEAKYLENGAIESFAANFVQHCEKSPDLIFGTLRYNSAVPMTTQFKDFLSLDQMVFYVTRCNPATGEKFQPLFMQSRHVSFRSLSLYSCSGIEVGIEDENRNMWTLVFAAPQEVEFKNNEYLNAQTFTLHPSSLPAFSLIAPKGEYPISSAKFTVLEYQKGRDGTVFSLAVNFSAQSRQGDIAGAIRFNSDIPVDLENPYHSSP